MVPTAIKEGASKDEAEALGTIRRSYAEVELK